MKVRLKSNSQEYEVVAISWPRESSKEDSWFNIETQFSVFDGHSLYDVVYEEMEITCPDVNDFLLNHEIDSRSFMLIWKHIAAKDFWISIRDYDEKSLKELQRLMSVYRVN